MARCPTIPACPPASGTAISARARICWWSAPTRRGRGPSSAAARRRSTTAPSTPSPKLRTRRADYAAGRSPRALAAALNAEGVPGPAGGAWFDSTIRGRPGRGDGLLRNALYAGRLVWNRRRTVRDPVGNHATKRANDPAAVVARAVPALRLVETALWEQVQARLAAEAAPSPPAHRQGRLRRCAGPRGCARPRRCRRGATRWRHGARRCGPKSPRRRLRRRTRTSRRSTGRGWRGSRRR